MFGIALLLFFSRNMIWIYMVAVVCAIGASFFYPNMIGMMGRANSVRIISQQAATFSIGWAIPQVISPVISGKLLDVFNRWLDMPQLMFPMMGFLALVAAALSFKVHRLHIDERMPEKVELEPEERSKVSAAGLLLLLVAWFALLTVHSPIEVLRKLFPKQALDMGFSAARVGILLGITGIFQLGVFLVLRKAHFWHFRYSPFYVSAGLMIAGMLLLAFAKSFFMMILPFALCGIAAAIVYHMSIFYSLVASKNEGRAGGINQSVEVMGKMILVMIAAGAIKVNGAASAGYFLGMGASLIFLLGIFAMKMVMRMKKSLINNRLLQNQDF